ncbi:MAG: hypothetical protein E7246_04690 [Lachnoclostridium sp.]|nr:hypothetical protein [Lachnoclostridium sp.]
MRRKLTKTKTMKKALAAIMVASLCMNQLSVGTLAADSTTDTVETPAGNVEVTVTTEVTVTDKTNSDGNSVQTIVTSDNWESDPNTEIATSSNASTTVSVTGKQTDKTEITTNNKGEQIGYSESVQGSEQTEITTTTTTSESQENVLIDTETSGPNPVDEYTVEQTEPDPVTTEGKWIEGTPISDDDWELIGTDPGQWEDIDVDNPDTSNDGTTEITISDPLDTTDVTLTLTPGTSDTEEIRVVTIEDLAAGNIEGIKLDENGSPVAETPYTETTDADGNIIATSYEITPTDGGYQITKKVVTTSANTVSGNASTPVETGNSEDKGSTVIVPTLSEELNQILANGTKETNANGENITTATETTTNNDGDAVSVKTEIREIIENDILVGYEVIKTTTTTKENTATIASSAETTTSAPTTPTETITLPAKPEASDMTDPVSGERTMITVEEVKDTNGTVIGYKTTTTITDAAGFELMKSSETVYGKTTSSSSTTTTDPTHETTKTTTTIVETETILYTAEELAREVELSSERTDTITTTEVTDTTTWQLVTTDEGTYFIYQGQMYEVVASGEHGNVTMRSLQPNLNLTPSGSDGTIDEDTDLRNPTKDSTGGTIKDGYDFIYTGYGLESAIKPITNKNTNATTLTHQFKLVDTAGNAHYVLCVDLGTSAIRKTSYNMENVETADYYKREGAAAKIKSIALHGYWGTNTGIGSLEECRAFFRDWLRANGKDTSYADNLTEGEALAATQAALWNYGNSNESNYLSPTHIASSEYQTDQTEKDCTNYFYQALLSVDPAAIDDPTTTFITDKNFATESTIIIKEKADDAAANTDDNPDNDVFKTDVSFTLQLNKDDVTGDLVVHIRDAENPNIILYTRRISGEGNEERFTDGDIRGEANETTYTFRNIQLSENVTITLNLEGTQNLAQGVYLYSAETYSTSQTFVGVASGTRKVDLNVNLSFEVTEPSAQLTTTTEKTGREKIDTETYEKIYTRTDKRVDETVESSYERNAAAATETEVYATLTVTEVTVETTRYENTWAHNVENIITDTIDDDPKNDDPKNNDPKNNDKPNTPEVAAVDNFGTDPGIPHDVLGATFISDDNIPLAVLPMTGDYSFLWLIASALSGLGLAGFSFLEKKKNSLKFKK